MPSFTRRQIATTLSILVSPLQINPQIQPPTNNTTPVPDRPDSPSSLRALPLPHTAPTHPLNPNNPNPSPSPARRPNPRILKRPLLLPKQKPQILPTPRLQYPGCASPLNPDCRRPDRLLHRHRQSQRNPYFACGGPQLRAPRTLDPAFPLQAGGCCPRHPGCVGVLRIQECIGHGVAVSERGEGDWSG